MSLNITAAQYQIVQSYAASCDYQGGWAYLASLGVTYAVDAYNVTSAETS